MLTQPDGNNPAIHFKHDHKGDRCLWMLVDNRLWITYFDEVNI